MLTLQVIAKFSEKISSLADDVKAILEEEAAEKEIAMLENRANRLEKELVKFVSQLNALVNIT